MKTAVIGNKAKYLVTLAGLGSAAFPAFSAPLSSCDCAVKIGACQGAIEFVKAYGSKPSFGAQFVVHSNHGQCSKVEYFIKNTPAQTILANKYEEQESTFGTSPIKEGDITFAACYICKPLDAVSGKAEEAAGEEKKTKQLPDFLNGRWCNVGRPGQWNTWRVVGSTLQTKHFSGSSGSYNFSIKSQNTVIISNLFNETWTITGPNQIHIDTPFKSDDLERCD